MNQLKRGYTPTILDFEAGLYTYEQAKEALRRWECHAELLEACQEAMKLIEVARQYFPKSMHNADKFKLESVCALVGSAIAKTEDRQ